MTDFEAIAAGMTRRCRSPASSASRSPRIEEGEATVVLPERDELTNHVGSQHAGSLFTRRRERLGRSLRRRLPRAHGRVTPLARSAEIAYEKIAKGPITASAKLGIAKDEALATLDRDGKVEFPCDVVLSDAAGTQVATATVRWHVRLNKPAAA